MANALSAAQLGGAGGKGSTIASQLDLLIVSGLESGGQGGLEETGPNSDLLLR